MRPYRGIPIDGKDFVYGDLVHSSSGRTAILPNIEINPTVTWKKLVLQPVIEVIPETVGQSIGLKDKNKTEIYKGDCFKTSDKHGYSSNCLAEVLFVDGAFVIQLHRNDLMEIAPELILDFKDLFWDSFEVIGNIHSNPELLERKENEANKV